MQIKSKNSLLMLLLLPVLASAAGIGKINVKSALGEPLKAEVEVFVSDSNELDLAVARLGSQQDYTDAGIPDAYLTGVNANIIKKNNGRYVIELQSNQAVNDPYLELLVKLDTKTSNLMRQYTVLLDPPLSALNEDFPSTANTDSTRSAFRKSNKQARALKGEPSGEQVASGQSKDSGLDSLAVEAASRIRPAQSQDAPRRITASDETYTTQTGDVFGKIAQRYQPEGVPLVKVMAAFYALNKKAFVDGAMHKLKAGSVIRIPDQESLNNAGKLKSVHQATKPEQIETPKEPVKELAKPTPKEAMQQSNPAVADIPKAEPTPPLDKNVGQHSTKGDPNYVLKVSPGDTSVSVTQPVHADTDLASASNDGNGQASNGEQNTPSAQASGSTAKTNAQQAENNGLAAAANKNEVQSSFTETLQNYWTSILIWLGLLLVAILAWIGYNKQRQSTKDLRSHFSSVFGEEILPIEPKPPAIEDTSPVRVVSAFEPSQQTNDDRRIEPSVSDSLMGDDEFDKPSVNENSSNSSQTVDPLIEAELYMTYGRHKQAETILTSVDTPYKLELSLGLLKIYADRKDKAAFERIVHSIHDDLASGSIEDAMIWSKVVALGAKIDPDNPLYGGAGKVNKLSARERAAAAEKAMRENLMPLDSDMPESFPAVDTALDQIPDASIQHEIAHSASEEPLSEPRLVDDSVSENLEEFEKIVMPEKSNEIEFTLEDLKSPELSVKALDADSSTVGNEPKIENLDDADALFTKLKGGN